MAGDRLSANGMLEPHEDCKPLQCVSLPNRLRIGNDTSQTSIYRFLFIYLYMDLFVYASIDYKLFFHFPKLPGGLKFKYLLYAKFAFASKYECDANPTDVALI